MIITLLEMSPSPMSRLSRYLARKPPQTAPALRRSLFAILILFVGCSTVGTAPLTLPTGLSPVVGGIADQRPYYGKFKAAPDNSEGDFLLATCGCGDWRVLMSTADGKQWQFPVRFYSTGDYQPTGDVKVFGQSDTEALLGTVHQDPGLTDGLSDHNTIALKFSATRGETHTNDASACVKCHIGDNPIRPQPPNHPSRCAGGVTTGCFTVDPPNCLSCHTVVIKN
jgi:hypothetical protein